MGRSPCCDEIGVKKGPWTPEEDKMLIDYIQKHGHGSWRRLPKLAGLNRCGKSCRLRWTNYLRPDIKRGRFDEEEEKLIIHLHSILGNKWSAIATRLPGRTDNEIKNYWNTHLRKKLLHLGIDPVTHQPRTDLNVLAGLPNLFAAATNLNSLTSSWDINNALKLHADAAKLARLQLLQGLIQLMASASPTIEPMNLVGSTSVRSQQFDEFLRMNGQFEGLVNRSLGVNLDASSIPSLLSGLGIGEIFNNSLSNSCSTKLFVESNGGAANQVTNSTPSLVPDSPENQENTIMDQSQQDLINSNDGCLSSRDSSSFGACDGLNLGNLDSDLCWKDILEEFSWSDES